MNIQDLDFETFIKKYRLHRCLKSMNADFIIKTVIESFNSPYIAQQLAAEIHFYTKTRCTELEPIIATIAHSAYLYAKDVLKAKWPEAEETIKKDKFYWDLYEGMRKI